jgi:hypothetical protein
MTVALLFLRFALADNVRHWRFGEFCRYRETTLPKVRNCGRLTGNN